MFDGVAGTLEALRTEGYHLAVATGKARRGLDRVLKSHGWEDYFDITRAADETASKPHPLMLEQILAHCNVRPDEALMVGGIRHSTCRWRATPAWARWRSATALKRSRHCGHSSRDWPLIIFPELHAWLSQRAL
nr:hypothetical protein GCM10020185_58180 [Pseudomonas brassicacearum subsp. brassicacearum]